MRKYEKSHPPDGKGTPPPAREIVVEIHLILCPTVKARLTAAMPKQSWQPPSMNCIRRSYVDISPDALSSITKALASMAINSDPHIYADAIVIS